MSGKKGAGYLYKGEGMLNQSLKAKGRRLQQIIVMMILDCFPSLQPDDVRSTPMGVGGEDVQLSPKAREFFPNSVECKNNERPSLRRAWDQTVANAKKYNPLLFVTWNRGEVLVVMKASHYFKLIKEETNEQSME